jgi:hypothetical protein
MDTLYNEIDKIVNDIRALKSFIIFEGSKFINKIITSSSDKDFIEFLKLKLKPSETIEFPDKRSVFEKIFKKRPEIKSLNVNYVTPDLFNKITSAMEEWNSSNKKTISDEKFKIIRMFVEKLSTIELNVSALYEESQNCDDLKQQKKSWEFGKNRPNYEKEPNPESPESPESEDEKLGEKNKENPPKKKSRKVKPLTPLPSLEETEKILEEKATELLSKIITIFNSSTKLPEPTKKYFQDKINENKDNLMLLLKTKIFQSKDKNIIEYIAKHIEDFDKLESKVYIEAILKSLELMK